VLATADLTIYFSRKKYQFKQINC